MALSDETLQHLEADYGRLLKEADEAALVSRRLAIEALNVARMLRSNGRDVDLPAESTGLLPDAEADSVQGIMLDDEQLEARILATMPKRDSGFKPSEMTRRLVAEGISDDGSLGPRILKTFLRLVGVGILKRRESDKRFQLVVGRTVNAFADDDDDLPF